VLGIRQVAVEHGAEAVAAVEFAPVAASASDSGESEGYIDGEAPEFALRVCNGEAAADIVVAAALNAARRRKHTKPNSAQHLLAYPIEVRAGKGGQGVLRLQHGRGWLGCCCP